MQKSAKILIVDDDPLAHELVREMLRSEAYEIDDAYCAEDALPRLLSGNYDLLLTDVIMPGMDGLTLVHCLHQQRLSTKVIIMTAESTPATVIRALDEEAFSYLGKPFTKGLLLDTVLAALTVPAEPGDIELTSAQPHWVSIRIRCKLAIADRLTRFFRELGADLSSDDKDSVATAFRELLMNAIEHGGHSDPEQFVQLTYVRTARSIIYYIRDPGDGFSLAKLPHAAISNAPEKPMEHIEVRTSLGIRPGGFGILMTQNFADELLYSEKGNEVMLIKYLPTPATAKPGS